jgi:hypothetical protein
MLILLLFDLGMDGADTVLKSESLGIIGNQTKRRKMK